MGGPAQQVQQDLIPHRLSNSEYKQLMISLNTDQQTFLHHVLHLMKTGNKPFSLFLSGGAGVGKSRCLLAIYYTLMKFYDSVPGANPDDTKVLLTAPTGKAAFNIQGSTIHSTFLIPANQRLEYKQLDQSRLNTLRSKLRHVKLLIIDEISMVGANMFNFINQRLQDVMGNNTPFGGVNLLLVGDLFQLRPVKDKWIFEHGSSPYASLAPVLWESLVTMFELTQVMRQSDDQPFASVLNRIREGRQTNDDINLIKSRMLSDLVNIPANVLHLFTKHDLVDHHNEMTLGALSTASHHILASDCVLGDVTSTVKEIVQAKVLQMTTQQTQNLMYDLHIKIDGRYMLVHNVDTSDGLTSGATGDVKYIDYPQHETSAVPCILWILFDEDFREVGRITRASNQHFYYDKIDASWTPVFQIHRQFRVGHYKQIEVLRRQFPLHPASAMTVHKSQGTTLDQVVLSFAGFNQAHLMYVALSRVKSLSGLYLKDFDPCKILVSQPVKKEMDRLRKAGFTLSFQLLNKLTDKFKIVFHNTRSLHNHIEEVRSNKNLLSADVLIFQESWQKSSDSQDYFELQNFTIIVQRNICFSQTETNHRPHGGTVMYVQNHINTQRLQVTSQVIYGIEVVMLTNMGTVHQDINISIYRPPKVLFQKLLSTLQEVLDCLVCNKLVLGGDFNVDASSDNTDTATLNKLMSMYGLHQLIHAPTTDYGSTLDLIFTNLDSDKSYSGVLESWYSDHKATWVAIQD